VHDDDDDDDDADEAERRGSLASSAASQEVWEQLAKTEEELHNTRVKLKAKERELKEKNEEIAAKDKLLEELRQQRGGRQSGISMMSAPSIPYSISGTSVSGSGLPLLPSPSLRLSGLEPSTDFKLGELEGTLTSLQYSLTPGSPFQLTPTELKKSPGVSDTIAKGFGEALSAIDQVEHTLAVLHMRKKERAKRRAAAASSND
jgi:hypothetical protein